jgi:hypothetical protein
MLPVDVEVVEQFVDRGPGLSTLASVASRLDLHPPHCGEKYETSWSAPVEAQELEESGIEHCSEEQISREQICSCFCDSPWNR